MAQEVTREQVDIPGPSLVGNLEGNATTRDIIVFLPPSYNQEPGRRYPVVYALHGYSSNNDAFEKDLARTNAIESAFGSGTPEMIVVMPDAQSVNNGSMYGASVTTGDWESYIADDVVGYVDAHYRTIAVRQSRGLVGHSMGGYGALRIGMKRPDVFTSLYAMSPCCLTPAQMPAPELVAKLEALEKPEDSLDLGFMERATLATGAAWSPNPNNPPFYMDLPSGEQAADVMARWQANAPVAMADQYMFELRGYEGIAIDVGDKDWLMPSAQAMHKVLTDNAIEHQYQVYDGDHVNRVAEQFRDAVMPFFGKHLDFE
ncbi:alpha/beta hydrolase [Marinihelvus fidelis]|nr:alpha/beta fold hydrolase [Marinihelvus fidelis]